MNLPRLNVITFMTEYKILTYFKPSFRCIFWILVMNPILKGVVSSVVKAVVYPYLYFYKIPIKTVNLSCYCWMSGRAAVPLPPSPIPLLTLKPGSRTLLWSEDPAMGEGPCPGPRLEEVLERTGCPWKETSWFLWLQFSMQPHTPSCFDPRK